MSPPEFRQAQHNNESCFTLSPVEGRGRVRFRHFDRTKFQGTKKLRKRRNLMELQ